MPDRIESFSGSHQFLSNFALIEVTLNGMAFPSVEHAYQAAKSLDGAERDFIRRRPTPGAAKKAGQAIKCRRDWEAVKVVIMENLLRQKFSKEPFRGMLAATGRMELIEGNRWGDSFWGMTYGNDGKLYGKNVLGRLLMKIRQDLSDKRNILV